MHLTVAHFSHLPSAMTVKNTQVVPVDILKLLDSQSVLTGVISIEL